MSNNLGINKFKFTTPTTITYNRLYFFVEGNEGDYVDFEVYAILEGDYTIDNSVNYPMSYGTKSTFSGALKVVGKNLLKDGEFYDSRYAHGQGFLDQSKSRIVENTTKILRVNQLNS